MLGLLVVSAFLLLSSQFVSLSFSHPLPQTPPQWRLEQAHDRIARLPGQPSVEFEQFSGYVTVNAEAGRALFYWLCEAITEAASKPLILWLNGGPGCSSLAYGAMQEIGPFRIHMNGTGLYMNEFTWTRVANILFLEAPAGVGFSYTNTSSELTTSGDARTAEDSYKFLLGWFKRFPHYKHRDFYIMGESYAGHYVTQLAKLVYDRSVKGMTNPVINLKGFMVGNPDTDFYFDNIGAVEYWWDHALISDDLRNDILKACNFSTANVSDECSDLLGTGWSMLGTIDPYNIYSPPCSHSLGGRMEASIQSKRNPLLSHRAGYDPCSEKYAEIYFNRPDVQTALHANVTRVPYNWTACSQTLFDNWQDSAFSVLPIYKELMEAGLRIWVFSGDVDAVVSVTGTRYSIANLERPTIVKWYPWYLDGQVGGHCQEYDGLTFVTIRNAGHQVPLLQPRQALVLIQHYLSGEHMPKT